MTFAAPLKVIVRLINYEVMRRSARPGPGAGHQGTGSLLRGNPPDDDKAPSSSTGPRVIVSQLHRSPGILFEHEKGRTHTGKPLYSARIIPPGSWLDWSLTPKLLYVRIDRRRKFPVTISSGPGQIREDLLNYFYRTEKVFSKRTRSQESRL